MDLEHVKFAIKEYLKRKDNDLIKLSKYADMKLNLFAQMVARACAIMLLDVFDFCTSSM